MREIENAEFIVVHCSATKPDVDWGVVDIHRWHQERGWQGCGYHFVIKRSGIWETSFRVRDGAYRVGAHCKQQRMNHRSIAICLVGGVNDKNEPEDNFTHDQIEQLKLLIAVIQSRFPQAQVIGHRDVPGVFKACPSFDVRKKLGLEYPVEEE